MNVSVILSQIDEQISKLQQARALLPTSSPTVTAVATTGRRGRPKGSKNSPSVITSPATASKRQLSDEGRKRIAAAMKKRWAAKKAGKKAA